ncbi:hypothetical protein NCS57_00866400 [Fusarium keratoplasticum]|uniref:Uncharacterized protein n=1 Tax=Fusarium keratoplasticum TaxID=1328300 RepID=A0ACC0QTN5_9HYPO|nr:hypothetical protein NCS57_00866400 [Fusarium keratoplasticum]KAI8666418.1 hypothetical protein NCS57_00866400 [Fusarium keratoplasticum]
MSSFLWVRLTGGGEDDAHGNPELYFHIKFGDGESSYTTHNPNFKKAENVLSPNPTRTLQIPGPNGWYYVTRKIGKSLELDYMTKLTPQTDATEWRRVTLKAGANFAALRQVLIDMLTRFPNYDWQTGAGSTRIAFEQNCTSWLAANCNIE